MSFLEQAIDGILHYQIVNNLSSVDK